MNIKDQYYSFEVQSETIDNKNVYTLYGYKIYSPQEAIDIFSKKSSTEKNPFLEPIKEFSSYDELVKFLEELNLYE